MKGRCGYGGRTNSPSYLLLEYVAGGEFPGGKVVLFDYSSTAVPSEDSVVVAGGADGFGSFEPLHRLLEQLIGVDTALFQHCFCTTFIYDTGVIGLFVFAFDLCNKILYAPVADSVVFCQSVAHRQHDSDYRVLIV